jgi:hypothetical protein
METKLSIASVDAQRLSPFDLVVYRKNREVLTRVISLQKLWKDAKTVFEKRETKRLALKLINDNFDSIEKTSGFLGAISTPYILSRIRRQIEETLTDILEKYNIPSPSKVKKKEIDYFVTEHFYDDLDIWLNIKKK